MTARRSGTSLPAGNRLPTHNGLYVALDGPDGSGKSSQARWLVDELDAQGDEVVLVREPGDTPLGEALRTMLLDREFELDPLGEAMLFSAARSELVRRRIAPHLEAGRTVVSDRCFTSTIVYQNLALVPDDPRTPSLDLLLSMTRAAHAPAMPDAVFVLDVTPQTARRRRSRRSGEVDRFESRDGEFQERVCEGFRSLVSRDDVAALFAQPVRDGAGIQRIDAEASGDAVRAALLDAVLRLRSAGHAPATNPDEHGSEGGS